MARLLLGERPEPGHAAVRGPTAVVAVIGVVPLPGTGGDVHPPIGAREPRPACASYSDDRLNRRAQFRKGIGREEVCRRGVEWQVPG